MAKRKAPSSNGAATSKAQSIRDAKKELGRKGTAPAIVTHLAEKGVEVSLPHVYGILAGKKKKRGGKRRTAAPAAEAAPALPKDAISLQHLIAAKHLVVQLGGVKQAQQAIAAVAKIG